MQATQGTSASIYDRIGGAAAVTAAVDLFYNKVIKDALLQPFFADLDLNRQRRKQVAFLTAAFGGPTKYTGKDLRAGHAHLVKRGMSDAHFDAVARHLLATLKEARLPLLRSRGSEESRGAGWRQRQP
jgi:hemoglobin